MGVLEIVLLILGAVLCAVSFILPKRREELDEDSKRQAGEQIRSILNKEIAGVQTKIDEVISESVEETSAITERALEKMTNEKIMAINEYSDTVIDDINKNHKEVLFLYDMLNDKHVTIRNTVTEVEKTIGEVMQTAKDIEISAKETAKEAKNSEDAVKRATDIASRAEKTADLTAQNIEMDVRRIVEGMIRGRVEETLEKTAAPMIQERVDELLSDVSMYMEQQPKLVIGEEHIGKAAEEVKSAAAEADIETEAGMAAKAGIAADAGMTADAGAAADVVADAAAGKTYEKAEQEALAVSTDAVPDESIENIAAEASILNTIIEEAAADEPEQGFVQGIAESAPKIIIEGVDEENLQYYVLEPDAAAKKEREIPVQPESSNSNAKILSLHKAGMSNVAIAKELGLGVGEVKLVIDLFEGM